MMCDEEQIWLSAYLDGELTEAQTATIERHLASCPACRVRFQELRRVSDLLRTVPEPAYPSPERFSSRLLRHLPAAGDPFPVPDRSGPLGEARPPSPFWWLVPSALALAWIILGCLLTLSNGVALAGESGLLGPLTAWLPSGGVNSLWFSAALGLAHGPLQLSGESSLTLFDALFRLTSQLAGQFFWQALLAALYASWLAAWWLRGRPVPARRRNP